MDKTAFRKNIFPFGKFDYVHGGKPRVKCILCSILSGSKKVVDLTVLKTPFSILSINLYPYSPGHLLLFPRRHITDITGMNQAEWLDTANCMKSAIKILRKLYKPRAFNIGMNMGHAAGASISHIHWHIVPRYKNELGFMDILTGRKIYVEQPQKSLERIIRAFKNERTG